MSFTDTLANIGNKAVKVVNTALDIASLGLYKKAASSITGSAPDTYDFGINNFLPNLIWGPGETLSNTAKITDQLNREVVPNVNEIIKDSKELTKKSKDLVDSAALRVEEMKNKIIRQIF